MPGAGGIRAMLYLNAVAPKDGTTIGLVHSSVPFAPLYGTPRREFRSAPDALDRQHHLGVRHLRVLGEVRDHHDGSTCSSASSSSAAPAPARRWKPCRRCSSKLFGAKVQDRVGLQGRQRRLSRDGARRGARPLRRARLVDQVDAAGLVPGEEGRGADPDRARSAIRNSPTARRSIEFVKDERTRQILELILSPFAMDRPMLAPPGTPPERVAALRKAFSAAMRDPGFIAEAQKQNLEIKEISGETRHRGAPPRLCHAARGHQGRQRRHEPHRDGAVATG